ncbi:hypothetical protein MMR90_16495, partial [Escherichia coli]|nr:hypothetical protein [Escherichia coli]
PFRLPGVTFFCISDTLVPTTYLVDTTLSNLSDSDQTVQAVRLLSIASMASDGFIHVFPVKKDKTPRTGKVAGDSRK